MPHGTNLVIDQVMPCGDTALGWLRQRLGKRAFEAEDILQDVLVRMLGQKLRRLRHPDKYLLRACANGVKEHFRKSIRRIARDDRYRAEQRVNALECDLRDLCDDSRLSALTREQLQVAWLVALGFSLVEAAEWLGISPGAARVRMHAARRSRKRSAA